MARTINRLLGEASLEVTVRDRDAASILRERLPAGALIHITHLPHDSIAAIVEQAKRLAEAGFAPVAHIAARSLRDERELDDYIARLVGEAGAARVLLVAGDLATPRGSFAASLGVLNTGLLEKHGLRVSFALHPEPHPRVAADALRQALLAKLAYAAQHDLDAELISQFCFEAAPILECIRSLRQAGIAAPVRIGAAAPTNAARMLQFALRCGVGPSLRALEKHAAKLGGVLTSAGPEALVAELAVGLDKLGAVRGMHFFVFGGVAPAAAWLRDWRAATGNS
jgi:methylenetetrahydrofolate reductase (NADPH)